MNPSILVITSTLGNRETLKRTINSVKNIGKDYVDHYIIVPAHEYETLKNSYPNSKIISEPSSLKKGIYPSLNYAFNLLAKDYNYITFINDDDYWLPEFKILINTVENDKNIDFVYGRVKFVNENNSIIKKQASSNQFYSFLSLMHSEIVLFTQQATIMKADLFFKLGGFSEEFKLVSDSKFWIDLSLIKPNFRYLNKEFAVYTIQNSQLSADKELQNFEHNKLLKLYSSIPFWKIFLDRFIFRISNIKIYLNRL